MRRLIRVSLQTKILGLVVFLILLVLGILTMMFAFMESKKDVKNAEELALQTAKTLSYMPVIQKTFQTGSSKQDIYPIAEQIRDQVDASAVWIKNRDGTVYAAVGERSPSNGEDQYRALVFGSYYVKHTGKGDNEILEGIAPVYINYGDYGKIEGTITVAFKMNVIHQNIYADIRKMVIASFYVLFLGMVGSYLLSRSIRKDTMGLEPYEISALYRERDAILQSVKEGILAIDHQGYITMMNWSAKQLLGIEKKVEGQVVSEVLFSIEMLEIVTSPNRTVNKELQYKDKIIIINTQPILQNGQRVGTVASFKDKTEIKKMVDALSEVKRYSEDLRAQTHEFTNKLHVILGLIQLGKIEEATTLILEESHIQEQHTDLLFNKICDEKVQAILLGKLAKASEKKVQFSIDEESSLQTLPTHFELSPLIVILGNLIDNAFEAVADQEEKRVSFFVTDIGNDIIFEIADSGKGIQDGMGPFLFEKGFSSKGEKRGYGLANVKDEVELLGGSIEFNINKKSGTVFTVFLPKS